jgi:SPX domain protein involved in polyphosphate accumulation
LTPDLDPQSRVTSAAGWTAADEEAFTRMLTKELDKIHDFQKSKVSFLFHHLASRKHLHQTSELSRRIREAEKDVQRLVQEEVPDDLRRSKHNSSSIDVDPERQQPYVHDGGSDDDLSDEEGDDSDESYDALEARFHGLEEEVAILVADVHDLALYTKLNVTGFMKILKVNPFHSMLHAD